MGASCPSLHHENTTCDRCSKDMSLADDCQNHCSASRGAEDRLQDEAGIYARSPVLVIEREIALPEAMPDKAPALASEATPGIKSQQNFSSAEVCLDAPAMSSPIPEHVADKTFAGRYARLAVRYPCAMLLALVALVLPVACFGVLGFDMGHPEAGQAVRDSREAEWAHAYKQASRMTSDVFEGLASVPQQTGHLETLNIYYVAGSTEVDDDERTKNVLTVENIQKMAALEDSLLALGGGDAWRRVCRYLPGEQQCKPIISAVPFLRNATDEASLRVAIDDLYARPTPAGGEKGKWFFEQRRDTGSRYVSYIMRSSFELGCPIVIGNESFLNCGDRKGEQAKEAMAKYLLPAEKHLRSVASTWGEAQERDGAGVGLLFASNRLYKIEYEGIILKDLSLIGASVACVVCVLLVYTSSPFLAFFGISQVLLAFPVTLFIYRKIFGINMFGVLQVMSVFILLGIGADDVLVLTGALFLEGCQRPAEDRFAKALRSSFAAMPTTSVTTAAAFGMTAIIEVPTVRYFAIFCVMMVLVNFVLVCTFYFLGLALWERHLRFRPCCNVARSQFGSSCSHRILQGMTEGIGRMVTTNPLKVLGVFAILALTFIYFAATLELPNYDVGNPHYSKSHPLGRRWHLELDSLYGAEGSEDVRLVMGIDGIDRTGTDETDDDDLGKPIFNTEFNLSHPDSQEYVVWLCDEVEKEGANLLVKRIRCFMRELKAWRLARQESFPVPPLQFNDVARECAGRKGLGGLGYIINGDGREIRFASVKITTSVHITSPYPVGFDLKRRWMDFISGLGTRRAPPPTVGAPLAVSSSFVRLQMIDVVQKTAWTSVGTSTAIAFIVLVFCTRNWRIATLVTVTIGGVVIAVVGLINIYGWYMDVFEGVCITILVGFSVDYTVHLGIAYADHRGFVSDRKARAFRAISTLGISVTAGAASTAGACLLLFPATLLFLRKFGIFTITAVVAAFCYSMFAFIALLAVLGPTGDQGELPSIQSLFARCWRKGRRVEEQSGRTAEDKCANLNGLGHQVKERDCRDDRSAYSSAAVPTRFAFDLWHLIGFYFLCALFLVVACVYQYVLPRDVASSTKAESRNTSYSMPRFHDLKEGVWEEFRPKGGTTCSRGTPFSFFVRKGLTNKVLLDFMGGGACWSKATCGLRHSTFSESLDGLVGPVFRLTAAADRLVGTLPTTPGSTNSIFSAGLKDRSAPEASWTNIYVPYCTGDLHWGNATVTYMPGVTVHHRGAVNAQSAVDWLMSNLPSPDVVLVTGCSAGAYGSLLWAARLASFYVPRGTRLVQFGDSGEGVFSQNFIEEAYPNWNTADAWPWEIFPSGNLDAASSGMGLNDFYRLAASAYPNASWMHYTSAYDWNQAYFYYKMLDDDFGTVGLSHKLNWSTRMREIYNDSALRALPNFFEFIGSGDEHCAIIGNRFWWKVAGGNTLHEWVRAQTSASSPSASSVARLVDCASDGPNACSVGLEM